MSAELPDSFAADLFATDPTAVLDQLLVARGAVVDTGDAGGVTALHRAARARSPRAVATLLKANADPGVRTKRGSTPLQMVSSSTGAGGTAGAVAEQREIQKLLAAVADS